MSNAEMYAVSAELEKTVMDESEARRGYYILLTKFSHLFTEEELEQFNLIIAEELKHTIMLNAMIERINKIKAEEI